MILALDCATKTGWCLWNNGIIESGVQDFTKQRGDSNGMMFLRFRAWINNIVMDYPVIYCAYEQAHHRGGAATEICVNLTGRVQECCVDNGIECMAITTGELKKSAGVRHNSKKPEMIEKAREIIGREPIDDNEADAILLAKAASKIFER